MTQTNETRLFCTFYVLANNVYRQIYFDTELKLNRKKRPPLFTIQPITITHSHHFSSFFCVCQI